MKYFHLMAYKVFWLVNRWDALAVHLQVQSLISCDTFWLVFLGMQSSLLIHWEKMPWSMQKMMCQKIRILCCILHLELLILCKRNRDVDYNELRKIEQQDISLIYDMKLIFITLEQFKVLMQKNMKVQNKTFSSTLGA